MASAEKGEDSREQRPPSSPSQPQRPASAVPKRKPVPALAPVEPSAAVAPPEIKPAGPPVTIDDEKGPQLEWEATTTEHSYFTQGRRRGVKFALPAFASSFSGLRRNFDARMPFANDRRKRRFFIGGVIAAVVIILALIIGLAAGLTVGRRHGPSNLPLPTNHGGPYQGDLTYYAPGLGACGITSSSSDAICAVSHIIFDAAQTGSNPNANPLCGLKLRLNREGKSVDVIVVDRCVGCKPDDIDTTTSVFGELAQIDQGRVKVDWAWLESAPVAVPT